MFTGGGRGRWLYPGATTGLGFANTNFAKVLIPFTGITSRESLYELWFSTPLGTATSQNVAASNTTSTTSLAAASLTAAVSAVAASSPAPGYPSPVVRQINNLIGGYYLEGGKYSEIAVLGVPSFCFSGFGRDFISSGWEAVHFYGESSGKTKLIIDVNANGRGPLFQGYVLFKQLFPSILPYDATRFRAFESTNLIGKKYSEVIGQVPRKLDTSNATLTEIASDIVSSVFNYRTDVNINYKNFPSYAAKFGPQHYYGGNFTNIIRRNLSDVLAPLNGGGIYITGDGNLTNVTKPFAAEDVIIITDGYCASTCTIFSELMRQQVGIKTIAMGGRSRHGISQAVGGVKGTNDFPWDYIQNLVQVAYAYATPEEPEEQATTTRPSRAITTANFPFTALPLAPLTM